MVNAISNLVLWLVANRAVMRRETVNLGELAHSAAIKLQKRDPRRRVLVSIEPGLVAHGDKPLLEIMLTKLLENIWKFTAHREKTEITFGKQEKRGRTVYYVYDNRRRELTHSIRLAIVRSIIQRHEGRIWSEVESDRGATFCFTLQEPS
jgi:K+-sensing histidine kinase KdpD